MVLAPAPIKKWRLCPRCLPASQKTSKSLLISFARLRQTISYPDKCSKLENDAKCGLEAREPGGAHRALPAYLLVSAIRFCSPSRAWATRRPGPHPGFLSAPAAKSGSEARPSAERQISIVPARLIPEFPFRPGEPCPLSKTGRRS